MKVFTLTDHSDSAVEALSARGTPNDGLLPGYYNGLPWPIRGGTARKGYFFRRQIRYMKGQGFHLLKFNYKRSGKSVISVGKMAQKG